MALHTWKLGGANRIVSLFTRDHGKVRAVVEGIRRTGSKFGARLESFGRVDMQLAEGRGSLETVTQVESLHPPMPDADYERFCAVQVLVKAADRLVSEDAVPSLTQYRLLLGGLLALGQDELPMTAAVDSYLLRGLTSAGWAAMTDACVNCGAAEQPRQFSPQPGGAVCPACRPPASTSASPELPALLGALLVGRWEDVRVAEGSLRGRAHKVVSVYATWHLDRSLRPLPFLRTN